MGQLFNSRLEFNQNFEVWMSDSLFTFNGALVY